MARIQDTVNQFREQLSRQEASAAHKMTEAFANAWSATERELSALLARAAKRTDAGQEVSRGWLFREARLGALLEQLDRRLGRFGPLAIGLISDQQQTFAAKALRDTRALTEVVLGNVPPQASAAVMANFARVPEEALAELVGVLGDGSPLRDVFAKLPAQVAANLERELVTGLTIGRNPRVIARLAQDTVGEGLSRTLRIARTEILRAYREATRWSYEANSDVIDGWYWSAAMGPRTCAACFALNGSFHQADEPMGTHANCRCSMIPSTRPWADLGFPQVIDASPVIEDGSAIFARQPEETQRAVLGPMGFDAYQRGEVKLVDFVARRDSEQWGVTRFARSLKAIRGGYGGDLLGEAAMR